MDKYLFIVQTLAGGLTNILIRCVHGTDASAGLLIRIFDRGSIGVLDHALVVRTYAALSNNGFTSPIYCVFKNGFTYDFIPGESLEHELDWDNSLLT